MTAARRRPQTARVGELRPSQMLFSFGVGSLVDLPNLCVMVLGLDDWDMEHLTEIGEERLRSAVRGFLGHPVDRLCAPPVAAGREGPLPDAFGDEAAMGVPVAPFPRWMRCPRCDLLAPLGSGLFDLKADRFHPDRTRYVHSNCPKTAKPPPVLPVRFLVACENGHLDDFPWLRYVHDGDPCDRPILRLREFGVEASDVMVFCDECHASRRMADAFGEEGRQRIPGCRGRRPQLRDFEPDGCGEAMKAILLGASNSWFPVSLAAFSIPTAEDRLGQLVEGHWVVLEKATNVQNIELLRQVGALRELGDYSDAQVWEAVEARRSAMATGEPGRAADLSNAEWRVFSDPDPGRNSDDFYLTPARPPEGYTPFFSQVVLAERLREVRALVGFTRIASAGEFTDVEELPPVRRAPLARGACRWVPAAEVRGEGIFVQFAEESVAAWSTLGAVERSAGEFFTAHRQWRHVRHIAEEHLGFPGIRYVLLHSFAHALMRQLALECGYTAASIRERIYSGNPQEPDGPMAGVLIYTAAPDSEGTLGGLVHLGRPERLGPLIAQALEEMHICASDPLCARHHPEQQAVTLHGAACHACLFAPETSCERGNRYLDRTLLVPTLAEEARAFFVSREQRR